MPRKAKLRPHLIFCEDYFLYETRSRTGETLYVMIDETDMKPIAEAVGYALWKQHRDIGLHRDMLKYFKETNAKR